VSALVALGALVAVCGLVVLAIGGERVVGYATVADVERAMRRERADRRRETRRAFVEAVSSVSESVRRIEIERARYEGRVEAELAQLGQAIGGLTREVISQGRQIEAALSRVVARA